MYSVAVYCSYCFMSFLLFPSGVKWAIRRPSRDVEVHRARCQNPKLQLDSKEAASKRGQVMIGAARSEYRGRNNS